MRLLLENVRVCAADGAAKRTLLAVDLFTLASGERLGLRGASGSGKTTFLKAISGILRPEGSVLWDDTDLSRLSEAERDAWRGANVGFLFQDFRLFDGLNALENVLLPVTFTRAVTDADRRRGVELLESFGVRPQTEASRLSRGEMQRTALVRVLLQSPAVILADGVIGQMMEKVVLPPQRPRRTEEEIIAQCPWATTGRTHGRRPNIITSLELRPEAMEVNNLRFQAKYKQIEENEVRFEEIQCDDADYLIVAFGSMARIGQKAMELAREQGIRVGILRPITLWPFPTHAIARLADRVKGILVTELNAGQMVEDVRLAVDGKVKVEHFGRLGGIVPDPDEIVEALQSKICQ